MEIWKLLHDNKPPSDLWWWKCIAVRLTNMFIAITLIESKLVIKAIEVIPISAVRNFLSQPNTCLTIRILQLQRKSSMPYLIIQVIYLNSDANWNLICVNPMPTKWRYMCDWEKLLLGNHLTFDYKLTIHRCTAHWKTRQNMHKKQHIIIIITISGEFSVPKLTDANARTRV